MCWAFFYGVRAWKYTHNNHTATYQFLAQKQLKQKVHFQPVQFSHYCPITSAAQVFNQVGRYTGLYFHR